MKSAILLVFVIAVFAIVQALPKRESIVLALSQNFMINMQDVENCINKAGAMPADFEDLELSWNDESPEHDKDGPKRAACAVVCCAHVQGTMVGGKINIPYVHKLINESRMPANVKTVFIPALHRCNDKVKNIEDKCDLGYVFVKCMIENTKDM